ncbi:MAG: cupin domain-containing protein [Phycisphaerales bacterium]
MPNAPHPTVHALAKLPPDNPMLGVTRQRIMGANAVVARITLDAGTVVPVHRHPNEQISVMVSGRMRFTLGEHGERIETLGPGEALHIPPDAPHGAEALETCVVLDVFSPPSEKTGIDRA